MGSQRLVTTGNTPRNILTMDVYRAQKFKYPYHEWKAQQVKYEPDLKSIKSEMEDQRVPSPCSPLSLRTNSMFFLPPPPHPVMIALSSVLMLWKKAVLPTVTLPMASTSP